MAIWNEASALVIGIWKLRKKLHTLWVKGKHFFSSWHQPISPTSLSFWGWQIGLSKTLEFAWKPEKTNVMKWSLDVLHTLFSPFLTKTKAAKHSQLLQPEEKQFCNGILTFGILEMLQKWNCQFLWTVFQSQVFESDENCSKKVEEGTVKALSVFFWAPNSKLERSLLWMKSPYTNSKMLGLDGTASVGWNSLQTTTHILVLMSKRTLDL